MRTLFAVLLSLSLLHPSDNAWIHVYDKVYANNLVQVHVEDGYCTGEVVAKSRVLTAFHCLSSASLDGEVIDQFHSHFQFDTQLLDPGNDLALLNVSVPNKVPIHLAAGEAKPEEEVMAIGYGEFFDGTRESFILTHVVGLSLSYGVLDHLLKHGYSGGPVVNIKGELVGVNEANMNAAGIGLYTPLAAVKDLLGVK